MIRYSVQQVVQDGYSERGAGGAHTLPLFPLLQQGWDGRVFYLFKGNVSSLLGTKQWGCGAWKVG